MDLSKLIGQGAVLSAEGAGGAKMLLAPVAELRAGRLLFYDLGADRARSLRFDREEWSDGGDVWLVDRGDRVARLVSVEQESAAAIRAWQVLWLSLSELEQDARLKHFREGMEALRL